MRFYFNQRVVASLHDDLVKSSGKIHVHVPLNTRPTPAVCNSCRSITLDFNFLHNKGVCVIHVVVIHYIRCKS